jgi:hypothetical protein
VTNLKLQIKFFKSKFNPLEKMNCRQIIRCYLSILVVLLFGPQPKVFAQSNTLGCQAELYRLSVVQEKVPNLTQIDIVGDRNVEQVRTREELLAGKPPYKLIATKEVPTYWQMRVKNTDSASLIGKNATYEVVNPENRTGNPLKKADAKNFGNIQQITTCNDDTVVVGEGVLLEFSELSQLSVDGTFKAQIQVCVPVNNTQCS